MPPTASIGPRAWATVDTAALQHNFMMARQCRPQARVMAVIKANAYGHGMIPVATALQDVMQVTDAFAVATLEEALTLRAAFPEVNILLMQGVVNRQELELALNARLWLVVHSVWQLELLQAWLKDGLKDGLKDTEADGDGPLIPGLWIKLDSGMNRLGLAADDFVRVWQAVDAMPDVGEIVLMSHLASADDLQSDLVKRQISRIESAVTEGSSAVQRPYSLSVAASGGTLAWPESHFEWLRPGIMLYGGSSVLEKTGEDLGLRPVMTLQSRLIAVKPVPAGESIGYGATYTAEQPRRMGIVAIGYGDGYPRHAPNGTPVLVNTPGGPVRTTMIGRVSMDMVTIDLTDIDADVGDTVVLWGRGLPADEIATLCGTISYELFCQLTGRVNFTYE